MVSKSIEKNEIEFFIYKLKNKIELLEVQHVRQKAINKFYRKNETLDGCPECVGMQKKEIKRLEAAAQDNDFLVPYIIAYNKANIRRYKAKIKILECLLNDPVHTVQNEKIRISINYGTMRLQIFLFCKINKKISNVLSKYEFQWSPVNSVYQRPLTEDTKEIVQNILSELNL